MEAVVPPRANEAVVGARGQRGRRQLRGRPSSGPSEERRRGGERGRSSEEGHHGSGTLVTFVNPYSMSVMRRGGRGGERFSSEE
jgi:hypothetical protein